MTTTRIQPEIRKGAKWLLIGEAPGADEIAAGRPFVGKSGKFLDDTLQQAGIPRHMFSITNVCQYRPPNNKIDKWITKKKVDERVQEGIAELKGLINDLRPQAILTVGNTPLWALLGVRNISVRRGSPLWLSGETVNLDWDIPLLPTLHPAAVIRDYRTVPLFHHDLRRFPLYARGELNQRDRRCVINPNGPALLEAFARFSNHDVPIIVDIEAEGDTLACCGFSDSPEYAICIPADDKDAIQAILARPNPKVFHNATYDVAFLQDRCGFEINGEIHDTMIMHRTLIPELPAGLDTLTSLYTTQPYYKDMGVNWKHTSDYDAFYTYNCLDCCVTSEIYEALSAKLANSAVAGAYERRRKMIPYAVKMSSRGFNYDRVEADKLVRQNTREVTRWQGVLERLIGHKINVFSPPQVADLLYKQLQLPVQREKGSKGPSTSSKKLMHLYASIPDTHSRKVIRALLKVRSARKFKSSYLNVELSPKGRVRSSFSPCGTETGRWSASKYLITEGVNLQTVPPAWRSCLVADPGLVMWAADYSQIEARFVAYDAGDKQMIEVFESGGDIHKENAARIFGIPIEQVTDVQRQLAKTAVHALNYNISPKELMLTINKRALDTGLWITLEDATRIRQLYLDKFDSIVAWQERQWRKVKGERVVGKRVLTNPFGSAMTFLGPITGPGSEHTKNAVIAFRPQSTVPDMLNLAIMSLMDTPPCDDFEVLAQVHDALIGQAPLATIETWAPAIKSAMDIPVEFGGRVCRVPVDLKVGDRWSRTKKV